MSMLGRAISGGAIFAIGRPVSRRCSKTLDRAAGAISPALAVVVFPNAGTATAAAAAASARLDNPLTISVCCCCCSCSCLGLSLSLDKDVPCVKGMAGELGRARG